MMRLNTLSPTPGAKKRRKRVGCGTGSGHGKTCGRGHKGQKARGTGKVARGFEGGQMPLARRLPKRGFRPLDKKVFAVVNVRDLARFPAGATVDRAALAEAGLLRRKNAPVKLLGDGEIAHALTVQVDAASKAAVAKIEDAGGRVILGGDT